MVNDTVNINFGVTEGSVLRLLLFILYVNYLLTLYVNDLHRDKQAYVDDTVTPSKNNYWTDLMKKN